MGGWGESKGRGILKTFREREMGRGVSNMNYVQWFSEATLSGVGDSWLPSVRRICTDLLQSCPVSCKLWGPGKGPGPVHVHFLLSHRNLGTKKGVGDHSQPGHCCEHSMAHTGRAASTAWGTRGSFAVPTKSSSIDSKLHRGLDLCIHLLSPLSLQPLGCSGSRGGGGSHACPATMVLGNFGQFSCPL